MPSRILKESIKASAQIDQLTWFEEVVFYRLIVTADDYGCYDGRPVYLKNSLFPTKENVTKKAVEDAISHLASVGLLRIYTVSGMPYVSFPTWERHQRIRNKQRKYPQPLDGQLTADCCQTSADCCQASADCLPESESESNIESESESKSKVRRKPAPDALEGLDSRVQDAFRDFAVMRTKMRKPMTDRAVSLAVNTLINVAGNDPDEQLRTINRSIERGWISFYADDRVQQPRTARPQTSGNVFADLYREEYGDGP